ncbi:Voltage-gated chloride channel family protein [hydrothermal vent metagenome]|uniref:Voltage-gated chloride channel family protein n=1 Tax=hydrothermal vent metagenome TaxID=652676 RepID=A0A3B0T259_9ZZZZ
MLRTRGPSQFQFWLIALIIGIAAGFAALFFRKGITALQGLVYGSDDAARINTIAGLLPWYWLLLIPILGGLTVGLILHWFTPDGRVRAVSDVIEGAALHQGRVEWCEGLASAAASFNAPIAGALFALEVVLRHFAVHAFAPIVIASVAGTVINRLAFGDITEFTLPLANGLSFYVELPAFLLLGLICGLVAGALMYAGFFVEDIGNYLQARSGGRAFGAIGHRISAYHRSGI